MDSAKKITKRIVGLTLLLIILCPFSSIAQDGQGIFNDNCGSCHTIGKGRLVGPDLSGVTKKRSEAWLLKWVKSSTTFIASGDADAKALFDQFKIPMPDQKLSEDQMKSLFAFITTKSEAVVAPSEKAKVAVVPIITPTEGNSFRTALFDHPLLYLYSILFIFVLVVAYSVINAKRVLAMNGKKFDFAPVSTYKKIMRVKGRCDIYATCSKFPGCSSWSKSQVLSMCPKGI